MLKKYLLKRQQYHEWMVMCGYDFKIVNKKDLEIHLNSDWELVEYRYLFISDLKDWFFKFNISDRITIIATAISTLIALIAFF